MGRSTDWLYQKVGDFGEAIKSHSLSKFADLEGAAHFSCAGKYKLRVEVARQCLNYLGGSERDGALLAKHVAGFDNRTTDSTRALFRDLPRYSGEKATRDAKVKLLAPLAQLSHKAVGDLGFEVGRALWRSVQGQRADARGGQKRSHSLKPAIRTKWRRLSYEGASGGRVVYGPIKAAAAQISEEFGESDRTVSLSTILKYRPSDVRPAKRPTDLCPVCEEGRRVRLKLLKKYGAGGAAAWNDGEVRQFSAKKLLSDPNVNRDAVLADDDHQRLITIEKHESLAATTHAMIQDRLRGAGNEGDAVCVADWAGKVEAKSFRQDQNEYFHPTTLSMLGVLVSTPMQNGRRALTYLHAYDLRDEVAKTGFRAATGLECVLEVANDMYREEWARNPETVEIWMDTAKPFRNKLLMYHMVVASAASKRSKVALRWFAEHHGKTILDASFRRAREWVGAHADYAAVKKKETTMEAALEAAYEKGNAGAAASE